MNLSVKELEELILKKKNEEQQMKRIEIAGKEFALSVKKKQKEMAELSEAFSKLVALAPDLFTINETSRIMSDFVKGDYIHATIDREIFWEAEHKFKNITCIIGDKINSDVTYEMHKVGSFGARSMNYHMCNSLTDYKNVWAKKPETIVKKVREYVNSVKAIEDSKVQYKQKIADAHKSVQEAHPNAVSVEIIERYERSYDKYSSGTVYNVIEVTYPNGSLTYDEFGIKDGRYPRMKPFQCIRNEVLKLIMK